MGSNLSDHTTVIQTTKRKGFAGDSWTAVASPSETGFRNIGLAFSSEAAGDKYFGLGRLATARILHQGYGFP